jgi:transposase InsO family protein
VRLDPFIEAEKIAGRSIIRCFRLFKVSRAAYYQRRNGVPSKRKQQDEELTATITEIHTVSKGTYGVPRVHAELGHRDHKVGRRRVRRLMAAADLEGKTKRRWRKTTIPDPEAEKAKDLIQRDFAPCEELDRRYVGDITYIWTIAGWAYLATVIDLASRRVVGWALDTHMRTDLIGKALEMAFIQRKPGPGLIAHSDRGCQYTSKEYGDLARRFGVMLSVGMKGECWDNAVAESFFATIKRELIDTRTWRNLEHLHAAVFDYIEGWYNTRRLHSSLGYLSPADYEAAIRKVPELQAA